MKRLLAYAAALVLLAYPAYALIVAGSTRPTTGGSCSTVRNYNDSTSFESAEYFGLGTSKYYAFKFTAVADYNPCQHDIVLRQGGSPEWTYTLSYYANNDQGDGLGENDRPNMGAQVGNTSITMSAGSAPTDYADESITWSGSSASLVDGTTYWGILVANATSGGYLQIRESQSPTAGGGFLTHILVSADGSAWTQSSNNEAPKSTIYE